MQRLRAAPPWPLRLCPPRKKFQKKGASQSFSKAARLKWQSLERRILDIVMQRMTIVNLEADMERLIKVGPPLRPPLHSAGAGRQPEASLHPQKREELSLLQEALRRKRERLQAESPEEEKGLQELGEEIEVLAANIDNINDSIGDCQATIVQLEETKVPGGRAGRAGTGGAAGQPGDTPSASPPRRSWTPRTRRWSSAPAPWLKPASCWTTSSRRPSTRWVGRWPPAPTQGMGASRACLGWSTHSRLPSCVSHGGTL